MISITKYIADDGKEFDDEEECENYERDLRCQKFVDSAFLLDEDGNKLPLTEESAEDCIFIVCKTAEAAEFLNYEFDGLMESVCGRSKNIGAGAWVYIDGTWETLDNIIAMAEIAKEVLER